MLFDLGVCKKHRCDFIMMATGSSYIKFSAREIFDVMVLGVRRRNLYEFKEKNQQGYVLAAGNFDSDYHFDWCYYAGNSGISHECGT